MSAADSAADRRAVVVARSAARTSWSATRSSATGSRRASIHWTVALFFFVCLLTGMPIWTPIFGWMAHSSAGSPSAAWLHPWAGVAFFVALARRCSSTGSRDMRLEPRERELARARGARATCATRTTTPDVGKYNGGQKLLFWRRLPGRARACSLSGLVMWFPRVLPRSSCARSRILLHDVDVHPLRGRDRRSTSTWARRPSRGRSRAMTRGHGHAGLGAPAPSALVPRGHAVAIRRSTPEPTERSARRFEPRAPRAESLAATPRPPASRCASRRASTGPRGGWPARLERPPRRRAADRATSSGTSDGSSRRPRTVSVRWRRSGVRRAGRGARGRGRGGR